jgi:methylamine dehydrogenase accessory protein MauD
MLMFVSPGCHICEQVMPSLKALAGQGAYAPIVVSDADMYETSRGLDLEDISVPVVPGPRVAREYTVPGTPYIVVLDELGIVRAKGTVNNLEQVEGLLDTARERAERSMEEHLG